MATTATMAVFIVYISHASMNKNTRPVAHIGVMGRAREVGATTSLYSCTQCKLARNGGHELELTIGRTVSYIHYTHPP